MKNNSFFTSLSPSLLEAAKKSLAKKLDPVGKEDSDINNDGKTDSTDSYLKSRRAAISKNVKEDAPIDEMKVTTLMSYAMKAQKEGGRDKGVNTAIKKIATQKEDVDQIDEARTESPTLNTRLISKHEGKNGHHAEIRRDKDMGEYQVHHYENGKHMGEGPVSFHGSDKEGKQDAQDTVDYELKHYRPVNGRLLKHGYNEEVDLDEGMAKAANKLAKNTYVTKLGIKSSGAAAEQNYAKTRDQKKAFVKNALRYGRNVMAKEEVDLEETSEKKLRGYLDGHEARMPAIKAKMNKAGAIADEGHWPAERQKASKEWDALYKTKQKREKGYSMAKKQLVKKVYGVKEEVEELDEARPVNNPEYDKSEKAWEGRKAKWEASQKKTTKEEVEELDEAGMPASVIKSKEAIRLASDEENKQRFAGKSLNDIRSRAWSHGYGKGSKVYDKFHDGKTGMTEEVENLDEAAMTSHDRYTDSHKNIKSILKSIGDHLDAHKKNATSHRSVPSIDYQTGNVKIQKGPTWGHVGDLDQMHDVLKDIHDRLAQQGEYTK